MKTALQTPAKNQAQPTTAPWSASLVQQRCACGMSAGLDGQCGGCRRQVFVGDKPILVQRKLKVGRPGNKSMHSIMVPNFVYDFSRVKVNFGPKTDVFGSIQSVLSTAGQSLPEKHRQDFIKEGLPQQKLEAIRVHTDHQSARSARLLGARAYQIGNHIVFGSGSHQPGTNHGNMLLRHEVAHVIQTAGRIPTRGEIALQDCMAERQAADFALKKSHNTGAPPLTAAKPACHLLRDPRLGEAVESIRHLPVPYSPQAKVEQIHKILRGIDLNDPDNLYPVVATIESTFGVEESGPILTGFLAMIDSKTPALSVSTIHQPSAEDEDRMQRQIQLMQIGPRGPYKQYGVGILAPVLSQTTKDLLLQLFETAGNAFAGAVYFLKGVFIGLENSMSAENLKQLAHRLLQSSILNIVFPVVFAAGAVVGIVEDVIDTIRGLYQLITNFDQFLTELKSLVSAFIGPDSRKIGQAMGEEVGRSYGNRISDLARGNIFEFSYGMGRMIGPAIVYAVLAFLGVPALIASAVIGRIMAILQPLLHRFPRLLAASEKIALRLAGPKARTSKVEREAKMVDKEQTAIEQKNFEVIDQNQLDAYETETLDLDFGTPPNTPPVFNEIDLGPTPDTSDIKLYRGSKPADKIPGVKHPKPTFGEPSSESSGTFRRTGMHFQELNAAEIAHGLRLDYDSVAGRPKRVEYRVDAEAAGRSQVSDRKFTQDKSTEGPQPRDSAFTKSGYDRGHLVQREAVAGDVDAEEAVDHFTVVVPMTPTLNRGSGSPWRASETRTLRWAQQYGSVKVEIEPVYSMNPPLLKDDTPIPKAIRRRIIAPNGVVLEDISHLNQ